MLSGILIFNQKGENLIFRAFRNDCRPRLADVFRIQVISNPQVRSPILTLGSTTFSHVKHENIYLVAITKSNANAALVFEFLYRLIALGRGYFGKFDEEAIKNNFVLVYELLDGNCCLSPQELRFNTMCCAAGHRDSVVPGVLFLSRCFRPCLVLRCCALCCAQNCNK